MKLQISFTALISAAVLAGCAAAPQHPVPMDNSFLQDTEKRIGIVMTKLPEPDVYLPGADCLLCIAAAEAMNSSLSGHVRTLVTDEFSVVQSELVERLEAKGVNVVAIEENIVVEELTKHKSELPNSAKRDYSAYRENYNVTHLLVVDIDQLGMHRSYASYVPTSDPRALMVGTTYMVSLSDNTFTWYQPISIYKSASGGWDEAPNYPALTNAYFQVIETGRDMILSEF